MAVNPQKLKVLFEDNHLLVVDKPALLPTMGVRDGDDSLLNQAKDYIKQKYDKPGKVYLGVVSRLDSFVTGVIVFARTSKSASRLTDQFRRRTVEKKYWAIVPSQLSPSSGRLEDRLLKSESQHRMVVVPRNAAEQQGEKLAKLRYAMIAQHRQLKLLEIELETGRKHQIRVQLENAGASIVGDQKYGSDLPFKKGIALHARRLVIEHPTQKILQSFESEPPYYWDIGRFGLSD
ncbi:MAG: RluA family pseudouridine synthase [Mariniblastus sp.]